MPPTAAPSRADAPPRAGQPRTSTAPAPAAPSRSVLFHHGMALLTVGIWSFSFLFIIRINEFLTPVGVVVGRSCLLAVFVVALLAWRRPRVRGLSAKQWMVVLGLALVGGPLYHVVFAWSAGQNTAGESRIQTALLGLIIATVPIHTAWLARVFLRERLTWLKTTALALGLGGVALVLYGRYGAIEMPRGQLEGPVGATVAAVIGGAIAVLTRAARTIYTPPDLVAVSGVFIVLFSLALGPWADLGRLATMPPIGWLALGFLGIMGSGVAYVSWAAAMRGLPAGTAATYLFLAAVLAALWGWLFRGETITWWFVPGAAMVLAGLLLMARAGRRPAAAS